MAISNVYLIQQLQIYYILLRKQLLTQYFITTICVEYEFHMFLTSYPFISKSFFLISPGDMPKTDLQ